MRSSVVHIPNTNAYVFVWISLEDFKNDLKKNPKKYAPQMKIIFEKFFFEKIWIKSYEFNHN